MSRPERHVDNITDLPRSCRLRENTSGRRPLSLSSSLFKIPINWSADSFQLNHVTSMSWHMSPRYGHVMLVFWQLSIDYFMNVQNTRYGLAKTRLRHASLPFDSLPYPSLTICRRVRTYVLTLGQSSDNHMTKRGWPYFVSMRLCPTRAPL